MKKILSLITLTMLLFSCSNYYKAVTLKEELKPDKLEEFNMKNKYYILRNGTQAMAMKNISLTADGKSLQCILEELPPEHQLHLTKGRRGQMIYRPQSEYKNEEIILEEVHFYLPVKNAIPTGSYSFNISELTKIEVLEKDKEKTKRSYTIGILAGTAIGVGAIGGLCTALFVDDLINLRF